MAGDLDRRSLLASSVAAAGVGAMGAGKVMDFEALGHQALIYVLPIYEVTATWARALGRGQTVNRFSHGRALSNARSRSVTTPNNDTLYSTGWLDLSLPVEITLPTVGARYFSLALMDAWSNNFEVLGGAEREGAASVWVWHGSRAGIPSGAKAIEAPCPRVWALARTYAEASGLDGAHAVQDALNIRPQAGAPTLPPPAAAPPRSDIAALFNYANAAMAIDRPPARDKAMIKRLAALGVGPGLTFPAPGVDAATAQAGALKALTELKGDHSKPRGGWIYPPPDTGNFGTNYLNRARVALTGLAGLTPAEAYYLKGAGDDEGKGDGVYDGRVEHRMVFRHGLPPTGGFWSVTLYEPTPEGQLYFFDNPENRYSVGSNTGPLHMDADGSATVVISAAPPADPAMRANWLPAPEGPYHLQFRDFRPGKALLSGAYVVPPVTRA